MDIIRKIKELISNCRSRKHKTEYISCKEYLACLTGNGVRRFLDINVKENFEFYVEATTENMSSYDAYIYRYKLMADIKKNAGELV